MDTSRSDNRQFPGKDIGGGKTLWVKKIKIIFYGEKRGYVYRYS